MSPAVAAIVVVAAGAVLSENAGAEVAADEAAVDPVFKLKAGAAAIVVAALDAAGVPNERGEGVAGFAPNAGTASPAAGTELAGAPKGDDVAPVAGGFSAKGELAAGVAVVFKVKPPTAGAEVAGAADAAGAPPKRLPAGVAGLGAPKSPDVAAGAAPKVGAVDVAPPNIPGVEVAAEAAGAPKPPNVGGLGAFAPNRPPADAAGAAPKGLGAAVEAAGADVKPIPKPPAVDAGAGACPKSPPAAGAGAEAPPKSPPALEAGAAAPPKKLPAFAEVVAPNAFVGAADAAAPNGELAAGAAPKVGADPNVGAAPNPPVVGVEVVPEPKPNPAEGVAPAGLAPKGLAPAAAPPNPPPAAPPKADPPPPNANITTGMKKASLALSVQFEAMHSTSLVQGREGSSPPKPWLLAI